MSYVFRNGLRPGIGPHEGRELELMLAGSKPLAMFSDVVSQSLEGLDEAFAPHVESKRFCRREAICRPRGRLLGNIALRYVYYALPDEAWRLGAMHRLNDGRLSGRRKFSLADEFAAGRLLGYSTREILQFVGWTRRLRVVQARPVLPSLSRSLRKSSRSSSHETA